MSLLNNAVWLRKLTKLRFLFFPFLDPYFTTCSLSSIEYNFIFGLIFVQSFSVIKHRVPLHSCQCEQSKREITIYILIISHYKWQYLSKICNPAKLQKNGQHSRKIQQFYIPGAMTTQTVSSVHNAVPDQCLSNTSFSFIFLWYYWVDI